MSSFEDKLYVKHKKVLNWVSLPIVGFSLIFVTQIVSLVTSLDIIGTKDGYPVISKKKTRRVHKDSTHRCRRVTCDRPKSNRLSGHLVRYRKSRCLTPGVT